MALSASAEDSALDERAEVFASGADFAAGSFRSEGTALFCLAGSGFALVYSFYSTLAFGGSWLLVLVSLEVKAAFLVDDTLLLDALLSALVVEAFVSLASLATAFASAFATAFLTGGFFSASTLVVLAAGLASFFTTFLSSGFFSYLT